MNDQYKGSLLIVDDIPANISVLFNFLKESGYKVFVSKDSQRAIQTAESILPDLILLDIMMPGLDGFEVCRILKSQPNTHEIPIIFMSALTETVDKIKGFQLGAADYITKPFHQEEVLVRINAHLNLHQLKKKLQQQNQQLQEEINIRKQVEESLQNKIMELDAFSYTVAHDLKNPLAGIINLTEVLVATCPTTEPPSPKWLERLNIVAQAGKQMINIIHAMLLLAGLSKQQTIEIEPLDMSEIINKVCQRLSHLLEEYQAVIQRPETWPIAKGYAPWIEEVWANYLSNGLKYGGHPPQLTLGADVLAEGMIRFWIRDNGIGLAPEAQKQLFTSFTRLHKDRAEGHGLGLSIARQIVEKLKGEVGVESEIGQGSLFYFTLPQATE